MENELAWKDNSDGDLLQYDFSPPSGWSEERVAAEQAAIAAMLDGSHTVAGASTPGWLRLAARLPGALRAALVAELLAGNRIAGIGSMGWPDDGSVVVNMRRRFTVARQAPLPGVVWRESQDPHYAREELSQKVDSVESLIIT